jgi:hypothetical protein
MLPVAQPAHKDYIFKMAKHFLLVRLRTALRVGVGEMRQLAAARGAAAALVRQFGGLSRAASASGFSSVSPLQDAILAFCRDRPCGALLRVSSRCVFWQVDRAMRNHPSFVIPADPERGRLCGWRSSGVGGLAGGGGAGAIGPNFAAPHRTSSRPHQHGRLRRGRGRRRDRCGRCAAAGVVIGAIRRSLGQHSSPWPGRVSHPPTRSLP